MKSSDIPEDLNRIAEEFMEEVRIHGHADIAAFAIRFPEHAERIRHLFPMLLTLEDVGGTLDRPSTRRLRSGEKLGDFQILKQIGRGGMGTVYEAIQITLDRHVALKVLEHNQKPSAIAELRFQREASMASKLHHTHIVPVYGFGATESHCYYAMQLIKGANLSEVILEVRKIRKADATQKARQIVAANDPTKTWTLESSSSSIANNLHHHYIRQVAKIGQALSQALSYAHSQRILHRDIKPSNILIDHQLQPWISDFGLAKSTESDNLTASHAIVGTLRYMAPERFRGVVNASSDQFSLGAVLYEMIALRAAFPGDSREELFNQIQSCDIQPLRELESSISRDLETIILKSMSREPHDRYASLFEMERDLQRFLDDEPIQAKRPSFAVRTNRWVRKNPVITGMISTIVILLASLLVLKTTKTIELAQKIEERDQALVRERETNDKMTQTLRRSYLDQAALTRNSTQMGQRIESLILIEQASLIKNDMDIENGKWLSRMRLDVISKSWTPEIESQFSHSLRYGQNFQIRVTFVNPPNAKNRDAVFQREVLSEMPGWLLRVISGVFFRIDQSKHSSSLDRRSPQSQVNILGRISLPRYYFDWTPAFITIGGVSIENLFLLKPAIETPLDWAEGLMTASIYLSPDGRHAAVLQKNQPMLIEIRDVVTKKTIQTFTMTSAVENIAWSMNSRWLVATTREKSWSCWEKINNYTPFENIQHLRPLRKTDCSRVHFNHNANLLLFEYADGTLDVVSPATATALLTLPTLPQHRFALFSKSGPTRIGMAKSNACYEFVGEEDYRELSDQPTADPIISPDDQFLIVRHTNSKTSGYEMWNLRNQTRILKWRSPNNIALFGFDSQSTSVMEFVSDRWEVQSRKIILDVNGQFSFQPAKSITSFQGAKKKVSPSSILYIAKNDEWLFNPDEYMHALVPKFAPNSTSTLLSWSTKKPQNIQEWTVPTAFKYYTDPNGVWLIAEAKEQISVIDYETRKVAHQFPHSSPGKLIFSNDYKSMLQFVGSDLLLWDTQNWKHTKLQLPYPINPTCSAVFHPSIPEIYLTTSNKKLIHYSINDMQIRLDVSFVGKIEKLVIPQSVTHLIGIGDQLQFWKLNH